MQSLIIKLKTTMNFSRSTQTFSEKFILINLTCFNLKMNYLAASSVTWAEKKASGKNYIKVSPPLSLSLSLSLCLSLSLSLSLVVDYRRSVKNDQAAHHQDALD